MFVKACVASKARMAVLFAILCTPSLGVSAQNLPDTSKPGQRPDPQDDAKALAAKPTPKTADGHPDLNGRWVAINPRKGFGGRIEGNVHDLYYGDPIPGANPETDAVTTHYGDRGDGEAIRKAKQAIRMPSYKPEFKAKVEMMGKDSNHYDPTKYSCLPAGVPRIGAPGMILETPGLLVFLYPGGYGTPSYGGGNGYSTYRVIPADDRAHRKGADYDPTPWGDPVAHWEGDTLVVDTTGFDDSTWFASDGYFHSDAMHVIERITRKGDTLEYSATVDDPKVLTEPYNLNPTPLMLKKGDARKDVLYNDDLQCDISDPAHDFRAHADHQNHTE